MTMRYRTSFPLTPMVKWIVIANVAVWVFAVISVQWMKSAFIVEHLGLTPERVFPGMEFWQPATYMWLHDTHWAGISHIFFNLIMLWLFGAQLELQWGSKAFLRFYLICGIGAGLLVFVFGLIFAPGVITFGASGAVDGLVIAWAIVHWNREFMFFGLFPMKGKHLAFLAVGMIVLQIFMRAPGLSHTAHIGGMVIGALLVTGFWRPSKIFRQLRFWHLRRKLTVLDGGQDDRSSPPGGGYWN